MTTQEVLLPLPESLYLRLQRTAQATQQSLTDVLLHAVAVGSPPNWEDAPAEFQADLATLERLNDEALWQIARSRAVASMERHQELLDKNAAGTLTPQSENRKRNPGFTGESHSWAHRKPIRLLRPVESP